MPGGQNIDIEPCRSCDQPGIYIHSIGAAGMGTVPMAISDCRPKKEACVESSPVENAEKKAPIVIERCKVCLDEKPFDKEHFKNGRYGLTKTCKDCYCEQIAAGHAAAKKKKSSTTELVSDDKPSSDKPEKSKKDANSHTTSKPKARNRIKRDINFYGHVDLMRAIEDEAKSQFRQFNAHVLFILTQHINQQKTGILP